MDLFTICGLLLQEEIILLGGLSKACPGASDPSFLQQYSITMLNPTLLCSPDSNLRILVRRH
eukprot:Gb_29564 [translate_table: standard]